MPNTITPRNGTRPTLPSRASALWKSITESPLRSALAIGGVLSVTAYLFRKKLTHQVNADPNVEDFTFRQQAMLERVREIWDDYCAEHPAR